MKPDRTAFQVRTGIIGSLRKFTRVARRELNLEGLESVSLFYFRMITVGRTLVSGDGVK